jgi:hypothetical protein
MTALRRRLRGGELRGDGAGGAGGPRKFRPIAGRRRRNGLGDGLAWDRFVRAIAQSERD